MTSSSRKIKKGSKMLVCGVDCKAIPSPAFKLSQVVAETLDPARAQSHIPPKVLLVYEIKSFYHYSIQEMGTLEMKEAFNELCVDGVLKPEHKHLETKGLTHILHMLRDFQVKWIRFILSHVHKMQVWLDHPILITKKMIHKITRLPMLNKAKTTKTLGQVKLTKRTLVKWDGRGMKLSGVIEMELKFGIHVIFYKIYSSR